MSVVALRPEEGGDTIEVPRAKTTIGRGIFMKVTDKRVSRNHAVLEINDEDKLVVTPIHTNPCFLKVGGTGEKLALAKDKPRVLSNRDVLGLLPDTLFFEVVYNKVEKSPVKAEAAAEVDCSEESEEEIIAAKPKTKGSGVNGKAGSPAKTKKKVNQEMALPLDKNRKLPAWMKGASKRVAVNSPKIDSGKAPASRKTATNAQTPKKRPPKVESDEDELPPKPTPKKGGRGVPKRQRVVEEEEEDWEDEDIKPKGRTGSRRRKLDESDEDEDIGMRRGRRVSTQNKPKYRDDPLDNSDSDLDISESEDEGFGRKKNVDSDFVADDIDSGSDWEVSLSQGSRKGKRKGRGKGLPTSPRGRTKGTRKKRKRRDSDSSDLDLSDGEAYVPRPSKRRGGRKEDSDEEEEKRGGKKEQKRRGRRKDESDEEEDKPKKRKKKQDSEDDDMGTKKKKKKRISCQFGKKCYRKNPKHFEEYCHPDDSSYDEDDLEEVKPTRAARTKKPIREKDKKSILHGASDDEGEANTYDYDDSFLAKDESDDDQSSSPYDPSDSDYEPEDEDVVKSLVKEAKGFIRNKKMVKPSRNK